MNWQLVIPTIITTIFVVIGWVVGHKLNSDRDLKNSQRQLRLKFLIDAHDAFIELGRNVDILGNYREIEKSIMYIQLFGTQHQIELSSKFIDDLTKTKNADQTDLVIELRNFIRNELGLGVVNNRLNLLKITPLKNTENLT